MKGLPRPMQEARYPNSPGRSLRTFVHSSAGLERHERLEPGTLSTVGGRERFWPASPTFPVTCARGGMRFGYSSSHCWPSSEGHLLYRSPRLPLQRVRIASRPSDRRDATRKRYISPGLSLTALPQNPRLPPIGRVMRHVSLALSPASWLFRRPHGARWQKPRGRAYGPTPSSWKAATMRPTRRWLVLWT